MHSEIGVESTPGVGSTFRVRLAAADGHEDPAHSHAGESREEAARPASHKQRGVLCIEDNPANLRLIERILTRRGDIRPLGANAMPRDPSRDKAAGFADYLAKPIDVGRRMRAVDRMIAVGSKQEGT